MLAMSSIGSISPALQSGIWSPEGVPAKRDVANREPWKDSDRTGGVPDSATEQRPPAFEGLVLRVHQSEGTGGGRVGAPGLPARLHFEGSEEPYATPHGAPDARTSVLNCA